MSAGVLGVRVKRGLVGESQRVVHSVVVPDGAPVIGTLTTVCGAMFAANNVDVVGRVGTPCMPCVIRLATG
ncbi:hypothetical protein JOF53_007076 [Crossiella equi]|uniref:Uncharacterized protein n=1 Tax=Crossiella equi TaxID=130796 RepID=A0ABS5ANN6_9PSEU|nr:hypothetical protein [Crossiella equi]MBP2478204.1 hypothetical protein [Crossiella equi]